MEKTYTVITGASSGIGRAAALAFAGRGHHLIVCARREEGLVRLREEIGRLYPELDVVILTADLSQPEEVRRFYQEASACPLRLWINSAGFGDYGAVSQGDPGKYEAMLQLNASALTVLSALFARDYRDCPGAQLINISSAGGYTIVPNAVVYCATKFYVSAFTEGLSQELKASGAQLRAKVLAPSVTKTGFGQAATGDAGYDYDQRFEKYHTVEEMAGFLLALYDSEDTVGIVDRRTFGFALTAPRFPYAGGAGQGPVLR